MPKAIEQLASVDVGAIVDGTTGEVAVNDCWLDKEALGTIWEEKIGATRHPPKENVVVQVKETA